MDSNKPKDVFSIVDVKEGKARWVKIGSAFINRDESINVMLDALPVNGKLQIRERRQFDGKRNNNYNGKE